MNMPAIGTCARWSRSAATGESTPPDMPTMTDGVVLPSGRRRFRREPANRVEREAVAGEPVVDAREHHRASKPRGLGGNLLACQPERAHDAIVERAIRVMAQRHAAEREAHELAAGLSVAPLLHAQ